MGHRRTVNVWGIRMVVRFDYFPAIKQTCVNPSEPAAVDLLEVHVGGVDIMDMLTREQVERIEQAVLDTYGD